MTCIIRSCYLCVTNMARALQFYESFFERPPVVRDPLYSVFDVGGFRVGLFAFVKAGEIHTFGSNCLLSIEVESLAALRQKLDGLPLRFPLTQIGDNWVAEAADSEGNFLELTAPVAQRQPGS